MRGVDTRNGSLFSYVDLEERVPRDHPLRVIRGIADEVLPGMSVRFAASYSRVGRPSIPPERLMRALLLQALYSIRSERQLMERLEFDLALDVTGEATVDAGPGEGAFDHPALRLHDEAGVAALDDLDRGGAASATRGPW
jgi:hypothetical protein